MHNDKAGRAKQEPEMITGDEFPQERVAAAEPEPSPAQAELDQLKGERDQLLDRLARLQAEFDNARKRESRERADARDYTISNTVEPFLGVMDNFQLALRADGTVEQLRSGVELILKQMEEALRGLNVQPVESVGDAVRPPNPRGPRKHRNQGVPRSSGARRDSQRLSAFERSCYAPRWSGSPENPRSSLE